MACGIHALIVARPATVPSSWHSTPIPPSQTRWISRYSGGRLSLSPTVHCGRRGSLMCGEQPPQPGPGERGTCRCCSGSRNGVEVVQQRLGVDLDGGLDEALRRAGPASTSSASPSQGHREQPPDLRRQPVGQPVDRAEVEDPEPAVGQQPVVAGVRVGVQQPGPLRAGEQELAGSAARPRRAPPGVPRGDDPGERHALQPLARPGRCSLWCDHLRERRSRGRRRRPRRTSPASRPRGCSRAPRPPAALSSSMIGLMSRPGIQPADDPGHPGDLVEVADQRLAGPRVLDLDRDLAAVVPHRPVHLADRGGRGRGVVEGRELAAASAGPSSSAQHLVHGRGRHRRRGVLQLGQRRAVRAGQLLGQRRLEDRHGLAELHGPALELAEHLEELLGGAGLDLGGDQLGRAGRRPACRGRGRYARRSPAGASRA